ncbi:MAG: phosphosulfolactate synthase [Clostridia bacterium]|nr:phosphosulfolactate synthase [Clostridia bacterium]
MVMDKGLGLSEINDLLDLASDYVDFIKLGFGTSALYPLPLLEKKIDIAASHGVGIYPGGTFLEVAILQGRLNKYLRTCRGLGFTAVEVSDGTMDLSAGDRADAIKKGVDMGFTVFSEVGKKDPRDIKEAESYYEQIHEDLVNGAFKVIIEGRESGKDVAIYDSRGEIEENYFSALKSSIEDLDSVLWEAPLKKQQQELIIRFGPNVNLGNIHPGDMLSLEALRVGFRGDTLRTCL